MLTIMGTDDRLDDLSFYSLLGVLQSGMWLQADLEKFLSKFGLSHGRFSILLAIESATEGDLIGNDLALRLGVSKPTIAKMTTRLLQDGLLRCDMDGKDGRKRHYHLTEKAKEILDRVIPLYVQRLRAMTALLDSGEKSELLVTLSKIDFLDARKVLLRKRTVSVTETATTIRMLCERGKGEDVDQVLAYLDDEVEIVTTKLVDYYLSTVSNPEGLRRIEYHLFHGSQIQRNYCTLFFARINEWALVNKAYSMGLIDREQAYSK